MTYLSVELNEKVTKKERRGLENRKKRAASSARLARGATLSMKVRNTGHICKKDLSTFKQTFFNTKLLPYTRLNPLHKLLLCQFVMHTQYDNMQPTPFVFRLPINLHGTDAAKLNKKLYRKLKDSLNRKPLYWTTREYDRGLDKAVTHINGEILLYSSELQTVRRAFKEVYGVASGGIKHAIRFPLSSRNKEIQMYGEFYAVYNWPGYVTKQGSQRDIKCRKMLILNQTYQHQVCRFHYISKDLNEMASMFYSQHIKAVKSPMLLNTNDRC